MIIFKKKNSIKKFLFRRILQFKYIYKRKYSKYFNAMIGKIIYKYKAKQSYQIIGFVFPSTLFFSFSHFVCFLILISNFHFTLLLSFIFLFNWKWRASRVTSLTVLWLETDKYISQNLINLFFINKIFMYIILFLL